MKCKTLSIKNVGIIENTTIPLNCPLILFFGDIRQGKSTILKAVQWLLGGDWPTDIIRHGEKEAEVELTFEGGLISRSWYIAKDKSTKGRPVVFVRNGKPVDRPAAEITRMLNPFQLNQNYLVDMKEAERKAYFTELFGVDTADLDGQWFDNDKAARTLRIEVGAYGDIDLTEVHPVDVEPLKLELGNIRKAHALAVDQHRQECSRITRAHAEACAKVDEENRVVIARNSQRSERNSSITYLDAEIARLLSQVEELRARKSTVESWLAEHPALEETPRPAEPALPTAPTAPDTSAIEQIIQNAGAQNVRAEQYQKNLARQQEKEAKEEQVRKLEARQREIKKEKVARLAQVSEKSGIKGLSFEEDGTFIYDNTQAGMLSTSQLMQLSSELSALYPQGLGLELLDRAESLGKSIYSFIERAQKEERTILAAIVGDEPAKVPEHVGVFVVEQGKVTPKAPAEQELKL